MAIQPQPTDPYLASFPRPKDDTGRGLHFVLDQRESLVDKYVPILQSIKVKWTTVYGSDENTTTASQRKLLDAGIFSVNRVEARDGAMKALSFWDTLAKRVVSMGLPPYIQIFNEPELEFDSIERFATNWNARARLVVAAGAIAGLQVMSREYFDAAVDGMADTVKKRFVFIQHNYGANHPPEYPYNIGLTPIQDDTCVLRFLAIADWARTKLGYVMPIIGGEGGWLYQNADDRTYPPVNAPLWIDWHYRMYEWFRTGLIPSENGGQQQLPDYVFSITTWLAHASNWYSDSWYPPCLDYEAKKPLLDKLESDAPYVRQFNGTTPIPPQPVTEFSLAPSTIRVGESSILKWNCDNIKSLYLNDVNVDNKGETTIIGSVVGIRTYIFRVIYLDETEKLFPLALTVVSTPVPPSDIVDPRCSWVTVVQGRKYSVLSVDYRDSKPADFPQSQNGVNIYVRVEDINGLGLTNELVTLRNGGDAPQWTVYGQTAYQQSGDSSFDPNRGQVGAYSILVGDVIVKGMGLPLKQHVEYVIVIRKND